MCNYFVLSFKNCGLIFFFYLMSNRQILKLIILHSLWFYLILLITECQVSREGPKIHSSSTDI